MAPQRKVLVAVDNSEDSTHAMEYVLRDVCTPDDKLFVLHVRRPVQMMYPSIGAGDFIMPPDLFRELQRQTKEEGEEFVKKYLAMAAEAKVPCEGLQAEGDPRDHILTEASKLGADLLVLGSRGLGAIKRALMGSVSTYCLNHASCPVLVVRPTKEGKAAAGKRTVVLAVDPSKTAKEAFRWALQHFCRPEKDHLVLVTAQGAPMTAVYAEYTTAEMEEKVEKDMLTRNRTLLDALAKEAKAAGFECTEDIVKGDAREALLWAVDRHQADLLLMGNRGLGAISRMFLGSVSGHCCHNAHCPVLVVKPHEEAATEQPPANGTPAHT